VVTANQVAVSSAVTVVLPPPAADDPDPEPLLDDGLAPVTSASNP